MHRGALASRDPRTAEPRSREGGEGRNAGCCYKHGIVFLHSDEDHVTVIHFRHNYLCPALRVATRHDATRLRRARTNRVSRYAKAVTDQNKIESNAPLSLSLSLPPARVHTFSREIYIFYPHALRLANSREASPPPSVPGGSFFAAIFSWHPFFFHIDRRSCHQSRLIITDDAKMRSLRSAVSDRRRVQNERS